MAIVSIAFKYLNKQNLFLLTKTAETIKNAEEEKS